MTKDEVKERYMRAKHIAVQALEDLNQGGDSLDAYDALEMAFLWKSAVTDYGANIDLDVFADMINATNP